MVCGLGLLDAGEVDMGGLAGGEGSGSIFLENSVATILVVFFVALCELHVKRKLKLLTHDTALQMVKKKQMNVDEGIQRIIEKLPGISGIGISGVSKVVFCC